MQRTQIYLDEDLLHDLREAADAEDRSMASIIREAARAYLQDRGRTDRMADDPVLAAAGRYGGGPPDGAENHDALLYGLEDRSG